MKQKILFLSALLIITVVVSKAQKEAAHWYFGTNAGLDFMNTQTLNGVTNVPTFDRGPFATGEGCFAISDKDGNFLFASDGQSVYNKNKTLMDNGSGLLGHNSSAQSGIVIPIPESSDLYYIVTASAMEATRNGLNYNIIDLTYNSGLGSVTLKNKPLPGIIAKADMYENLSVVGHTNGVDYWLIQRARQYFYVWKVTKDGFSTPLLFDTGVDQGVYTSGTLFRAGMGYIKFSPDGTKVIHMDAAERGNSYITFADFDAATGTVSNIKNVKANIQSLYGVDFSPSGEYVFIATHMGAAVSQKGLYVTHIDDLVEPSVTLTRLETTLSNVQLAMDGRIYGTSSSSLFAILDPDIGGASPIATFTNFFSSHSAVGGAMGLPPFITSFFNVGEIRTDPQLPVCMGTEITFSIQINTGTGQSRITRLEWDFGDNTPVVSETDMSSSNFSLKHTYPKRGTYKLTLTPYKEDNLSNEEVVTDKIKTMEVKVASCRLPVNHNTSLMDY
ncbi:MAG: PKD domain-containing protein [Prevotella sp.]|jgi:hypothetical protein|nr:PKD domain-containing protein [Prevotella sp.]